MSNYTAKKLSINIIFSIAQIFISALVLFFLYRYAIKEIGIKQFGIWSVVSTSITTLAVLNYGFSGSLVKYVAKYQAKGDMRKVKSIIETSIVSIIVFSVLISLVGYVCFYFLLKYLVAEELSLVYYLLKICLLTFCVSIISNAFQAALEGLNFIFIKSIINIVISITLLVLFFVFIRRFGLIALGYAYLGANIIGLIISIVALKLKFPAISTLGWKWDREMFKETLKYNFNFQIISVFSLLNDPVTKFILIRFGGTEFAGLYELANRLVMQIRNVLSTANQTLVPMFASFHETNSKKVSIYFRNSFLYIFTLSTFLFYVVLAFSPLLSVWWLGRINYVFLIFLTLITIGWYINSVTMPAYFANLGSGQMKWNTFAHVGMGISNVLIGLIVAFLLNPVFISIGWFLSLSVFSTLILVQYVKEDRIAIRDIMPRENWFYLTFNVAFSFLTALVFLNCLNSNPAILILVVVIYFVVQFYILFKNSSGRQVRLQLLNYIRK